MGKFIMGNIPWNRGNVKKDGLCNRCDINPVTKYDPYYCNKCNATKQREWRSNHREQNNRTSKSSRLKIRKEILIYYGGNPPRCACCNEDHYNFLSIDHKNNDGAVHRRKIGTGLRVYYWLKNNNYPEGFQVLCFNCNSASFYYGICPHKIDR